MPQWIAACEADDIDPEDVIPFEHDGSDYAIYRSPEEAVRSQYWMLVVMVGFTSLGLWLLSAVNT